LKRFDATQSVEAKFDYRWKVNWPGLPELRLLQGKQMENAKSATRVGYLRWISFLTFLE